MDDETLSAIESLFFALADKTRLRLLNLMAEEEVCVESFTRVLGDSQPKISRHLAYLRNANLVSARREGKWVYYSLIWPASASKRNILVTVLRSIASRSEMKTDREKYGAICGRPVVFHNDSIAEDRDTFTKTNVYSFDHAERKPAHNELDEFLL